MRERERCIQRQGYLYIAIVLKAMVLVSYFSHFFFARSRSLYLFFYFLKKLITRMHPCGRAMTSSLLISFEPNLKLAVPGIPVPTRITQSRRFLPKIDLAFGLAFAREYFLQYTYSSIQKVSGMHK